LKPNWPAKKREAFVKIFRFALLSLPLLAWALFTPAVTTADPVTANTQNTSSADGVRICRYVPGISVTTSMPPDLMDQSKPKPTPSSTPLPVAPTSAQQKTVQLKVLEGLSNAVRDHYVYADFRGHDWKGMTERYRSLIQQGLSDDDFYTAMQALIHELGDEHSYFQSPAKIKEEQAGMAGQYNFVGVGALFIPIGGMDRAAIMSLFAGGPAAEAGLRPHDVLLKVDDGPIRDKLGKSRTLGPEGAPVKLSVQHPGEPPRDLTLTRRRVTGVLPIDYCMVPLTRIGYIFLPTLLDKTMDGQVRDALKKMTADGPLQGLVLDNRMNGGGLGNVTQAIMAMFTGGTQGAFVTRTGREPLQLKPENIGGSQTVPLVVLVDVDTVSYGEIMSGVLRLAGRAKIVGGRTLGNVEQLRQYNFSDGSRAWIASATFEPSGMAKGLWEDTGIIPDVMLPTRWDLFTEANDPALAKAVEILKGMP
jgi:carboxyl-terminal processing protease